MWQRGHQIGWQFRWVTKKSDSIVTKNCDKFGDSKNMSPTLSPDWSQNTVNHQIGHQICHKICHQTPWGSYMLFIHNETLDEFPFFSFSYSSARALVTRGVATMVISATRQFSLKIKLGWPDILLAGIRITTRIHSGWIALNDFTTIHVWKPTHLQDTPRKPDITTKQQKHGGHHLSISRYFSLKSAIQKLTKSSSTLRHEIFS